MQDKFKNKNGSLTVYAFACGYVETRKLNNPCGEVSLFRDGACWHVQASDERGRYLWECFDLLGQARAFFRKQK